jgi:hypothetical protein
LLPFGPTDDNSPVQRSTRERATSVVSLSAATLLIVLPALGVLGTAMHGVPYVGLVTAFVPWYVPWLMVAVLAGAALALLSRPTPLR